MQPKTYNIIRTISKYGLCSRKQAFEFVKNGKVRVNEKTVLDPGKKISPVDRISVNGKPLKEKRKRYILFHKPAGYVTTRQDELGRPTVYEFLKNIDDWVFPVGRLDKDSEGLLILTNDTKFGNALTDPRYNIPRTYKVLIDGILSNDNLEDIRKGINIGRGEKTQPAKVKILNHDKNRTLLEITITEGKNREVRRLFEHLNKPVKRLIRLSFGPFSLGHIKSGKYVEINKIPINDYPQEIRIYS